MFLDNKILLALRIIIVITCRSIVGHTLEAVSSRLCKGTEYPIAQGLLNKKVGEVAEIKIPRGTINLRIDKISFE